MPRKNEIHNQILHVESILKHSIYLQMTSTKYIGDIKNIPKHFNPQRCGGILIGFHYGVNPMIGLAVDSFYKEITDFAGSRDEGETIIEAALRETKEETFSLVDIHVSEVQDYLCICDNDNLIIFIPIKEDPYDFSEIFSKKVPLQERPENSDAVWFCTATFYDEIRDDNHSDIKIYSRTRDFLLKFDYENEIVPQLKSHFDMHDYDFIK